MSTLTAEAFTPYDQLTLAQIEGASTEIAHSLRSQMAAHAVVSEVVTDPEAQEFDAVPGALFYERLEDEGASRHLREALSRPSRRHLLWEKIVPADDDMLPPVVSSDYDLAA